MNTSEVLNRAADHIERYGHHQGGALNGDDYRTASACLVGAITVVSIGEAATTQIACAAIRDHLGGFLVTWNDAPERTATEVVEALRAAAIIAAARDTDVTEVRPELAAGVAVTA